MKKTRFTEEQMVTILREADEKSVPEVAKKHGISSQTISGWRKHFGTLEPADIKRLRQLEIDLDGLREAGYQVPEGRQVARPDSKRIRY